MNFETLFDILIVGLTCWKSYLEVANFTRAQKQVTNFERLHTLSLSASFLFHFINRVNLIFYGNFADSSLEKP